MRPILSRGRCNENWQGPDACFPRNWRQRKQPSPTDLNGLGNKSAPLKLQLQGFKAFWVTEEEKYIKTILFIQRLSSAVLLEDVPAGIHNKTCWPVDNFNYWKQHRSLKQIFNLAITNLKHLREHICVVSKIPNHYVNTRLKCHRPTGEWLQNCPLCQHRIFRQCHQNHERRYHHTSPARDGPDGKQKAIVEPLQFPWMDMLISCFSRM